MIRGFIDRIKYGAERSNQWPQVRKKHLGLNPTCAICGSMKKVEVHHKKPFHTNPELELDPDNLISLCEGKEFWPITCHIFAGHLNNYKTANENLDETVAALRKACELLKKAKADDSLQNN